MQMSKAFNPKIRVYKNECDKQSRLNLAVATSVANAKLPRV